MERVLFIVNPLSEKRKGINLKRLIDNNLDLARFRYDIRYTEYHNHALELTESYRKDCRIIVAAGGDGTVNQVSQVLVGSDNILGLIPLGSGNGLARDLGIPLRVSKAINKINNLETRVIDSGLIGGKHFINMAGTGFDAEIAHDFAGSARRGLAGYIVSILRKFFSYKVSELNIMYDGRKREIKAFLVSIANTGQYGNNAYISPGAKPDDGMLDICFIKKFPAYAAPVLALRLFMKNIDRSNYIEIVRANNLSLEYSGDIKGHIDGEPSCFKNNIAIRVIENAVEVIV